MLFPSLSTVLLFYFVLPLQILGHPHFARDASSASSTFTWSPNQLVDVTGAHAYHDPLPGQARGPCPAQNALANHGYLDRSGYTTLLDCVNANVEVFNLGVDFATYLCFTGQLTGGDLLGVLWSIGNSSEFDNSIKSSCSSGGIIGPVINILCGLSKVLNHIFGTPGFGMAQTHNSFEADSSVFQHDFGTLNGMDASSIDMQAVNEFWKRRLPDGTFDDLNIYIDWASYRKNQGIKTNPCYFRAPQATLFAALGAYPLGFRLFSNYTPAKPDGTLTGSTLASFHSFFVDSNGILQPKGLGKEQIPTNWYKRPQPYSIAEWLTNDYAKFFEKDPTLMSIGGNTNGVNTFTGIDIGDLTGGVINGKNLLQGDNFACFYYRVLQIDLENKLPSPIGKGLLSLGSVLGEVLDTIFNKMITNPSGVASCPRFSYTGLQGHGNWCGVSQQPGGIY